MMHASSMKEVSQDILGTVQEEHITHPDGTRGRCSELLSLRGPEGVFQAKNGVGILVRGTTEHSTVSWTKHVIFQGQTRELV